MLLRSPLHDRHEALGAKFAAFGGWEMPLEYAGGGVIKEHTAVRTAVGVFDVSHLGKAGVVGPGAADFVNACLTNDIGRIRPGRAQYTLCCDDATGGVVDDLIAYLFGPDDVFLVPNAANTAEVVRRLTAAAPPQVTVSNEHRTYAILAVQGPGSADALTALGLPTDLEYMSFTASPDVVVCRTGYTGEHGYELVIPSVRLGGRLVQARILGPGRAAQGEDRRSASLTARTGTDGPRHPPRTHAGVRRGAARRRDHQWHVLADEEGGHRSGADRHRGRARRR